MTFQLPAHLKTRQSRGLSEAAMAGLNTGQPAHISIKNATFTLVDAAGNRRGVPPVQGKDKQGRTVALLALDVVLVDANPHKGPSKIYFKNAFDPSASEYAPPTCFSDNGVGASRMAAEPQHTSCQVCPHNAWGSDVSKVSGKQTKACNDVKKVAVLVLGADTSDTPFLLRIPPASLKGWGKYVQTIAGQVLDGHKLGIEDVVTRITFDPETQGVLNFEPVDIVGEDIAALQTACWEKQITGQMVGANDVPWDGSGRTQIAPPIREAGQLPPPPGGLQAAVGQKANDEHLQGMQERGRVGVLPSNPLPAADPPKRTRRTKAEMEADAVAKQTPTQQDANLDIPPFLRRETPPAFGVQADPPAPTGQIADALKKAFNLPT